MIMKFRLSYCTLLQNNRNEKIIETENDYIFPFLKRGLKHLVKCPPSSFNCASLCLVQEISLLPLAPKWSRSKESQRDVVQRV